MRIKTLTLKNFHGFVERTFDFSEQFTLMIGDNGSGKTAILDGTAVALGGFLSGISMVNSRHIRPDEIRLESFRLGNTVTVEPQFEVEIICEAKINDEDFYWERSLSSKKGKTTRKNAAQIIKYAENLQKDVSKGKKVILPVFAYHGTGRLWAQTSDTEDELFETGSRFLGYKNCLNPISNEKLFLKWFKKMTLISLQERNEPGEYKAVRYAIEKCLKSAKVKDIESGIVSIEYRINDEQLMVNFDDGRLLPFRMLSDGYRNVIGMVADIAFRMAVLNPFLEENAAEETPGIVLIDELDLHLHPKWQRNIVDDLKKAFPKIQFIATTHSPFIIQSLEQGELRVLDEEIKGGLVQFENMSIEDVIENVMGIDLPQWSQRRKEMYEVAEKYFRTLKEMKESDENKIIELKQKLDILSEPFADNLAYYAFLKQERLLAENEIRKRS